MRRFSCLALAALTLVLPAISRADEASDRNQAAAALAAAVLPPSQYADMMEQIVSAALRGMESSVARAGKTLPATFAPRFREEMERLLPYQELVDLQAGLLAKYYETSEINDLAAFYRSPLGQKTLKIMPSVMADCMAMVQDKLSRELPGAVERLLKTELEPEDEPVAAKPEKADRPAPALKSPKGLKQKQ